MKKRAPEPASFDLDYPEDLNPISHVPIKPTKLEDPGFSTADKENQGNILGNQQQENIQQQQKKADKSDKQTKEILKMIVEMNDVF